MFDHPIGNLKQFVPPTLTTGIVLGLWSARIARRAFNDNAVSLRSIATTVAIVAVDVFPWVLGSLVLVEQTYSIPGLANYLYGALYQRDARASEAVVLLFLLLTTAVWVVRPLLPHTTSPPRDSDIDWRWTRRNRLLLVGAIIVLAYVVVGLAGPWVAAYDAAEFAGKSNENPSFDHWLGTERLGRDIFSRLLYADRTSLELSATVLLAGFLPGAILGLFVSRGPAWLVEAAREVAALWFSMPLIIISFMFVFTLFPGFKPLAICFAMHAFLLGLRVPVSQDVGTAWPWSHGRGWAPYAGAAALGAAATILGETTVAYFGFGIPYDASWGGEMSKAREFVPYPDWAVWPPFVAVLISACGFLLVRTSLDDVDPPQMYER